MSRKCVRERERDRDRDREIWSISTVDEANIKKWRDILSEKEMRERERQREREREREKEIVVSEKGIATKDEEIFKG